MEKKEKNSDNGDGLPVDFKVEDYDQSVVYGPEKSSTIIKAKKYKSKNSDNRDGFVFRFRKWVRSLFKTNGSKYTFLSHSDQRKKSRESNTEQQLLWLPTLPLIWFDSTDDSKIDDDFPNDIHLF